VPEKKLTGRIAREKIKMMEAPRPPAGVVERFKTLGDCTGVISDTMDELGIPLGVVGASVLKPTMPGTTMVGPALTIRNILQRIDPLAGARDHVNKMGRVRVSQFGTAG
jgi:4-hydroxy-4-methyl-2-oxoglutarate aldolase